MLLSLFITTAHRVVSALLKRVKSEEAELLRMILKRVEMTLLLLSLAIRSRPVGLFTVRTRITERYADVRIKSSASSAWAVDE